MSIGDLKLYEVLIQKGVIVPMAGFDRDAIADMVYEKGDDLVERGELTFTLHEIVSPAHLRPDWANEFVYMPEYPEQMLFPEITECRQIFEKQLELNYDKET